jgi:hypothetical protein
MNLLAESRESGHHFDFGVAIRGHGIAAGIEILAHYPDSFHG